MTTIDETLALRFGDAVDGCLPDTPLLRLFAEHKSCRAFKPEPVEPAMIRSLCALALSSPSKSDLQQRDILIVEDPDIRGQINALLEDQEWIAGAPSFLVFLGNNRRQRQLHEWRDKPFPNDHLDAFFNAAVDAGIALSTFILAAQAAGLGACPISAIRNHSSAVSDILGLPDHVFPIAGLGLGTPARDGYVSLRLPLATTIHTDRFDDANSKEQVEAYDRRRTNHWPYRSQRYVSDFDEVADYGWSEDKARQYAKPERADFGAFVQKKGFKLI